MTQAAQFLELIKNILVIACLCVTLCAACRQQQENEELKAQISALYDLSETVLPVKSEVDIDEQRP